jgi:hypothetical protein
MNVLWVFGIKRITRKFVLEAVGALLLLGLSVNGLYDLFKMLTGWGIFFLPVIFFVLVYVMYRKYKEATPEDTSSEPDTVKPHKGIVLALSKPWNKSPDDICRDIENTAKGDPKELFKITGIGQLFKGIYCHKEKLRLVWLLTTEASRPYEKCIGTFLKGFVSDAKISEDEDIQKVCRLPGKTDQEWIEQCRFAISEIYSATYLESLGLKESDIITDISGGPKSLTIGMTFGALSSDVDIQYVEQTGHNVIPLKITPDMIFKEFIDHLNKFQKNSAA